MKLTSEQIQQSTRSNSPSPKDCSLPNVAKCTSDRFGVLGDKAHVCDTKPRKEKFKKGRSRKRLYIPDRPPLLQGYDLDG